MAGKGGLAEKVRTRLELVTPASGEQQSNNRRGDVNTIAVRTTSQLDAVTFGKSAKQHVQEFAALFATIILGIAAYKGYHGRPLSVITGLTIGAGVLLLIGYKLPAALHPVWKAWMYFAHKLSVVMTFVFLTLTWTIMVMPIALILRLTGKRVMEMGFKDGSVGSYWEVKKKAATDFKLLERQF